ncbi:MAG: hypothetical protein WAW37_20470 [Syntrophobacteraceae bacterium]
MTIIKLKIKTDCPEALKKDDTFLDAIQLSRIVNALMSNLRSCYNVNNNDRLLDAKDRIDLLIAHGALMYEGTREFSKMCCRLKLLPLWCNDTIDSKWLTKEIGNGDSFRNTVLKIVRDKLFFHFDRDIISNTLAYFNFGKEIIFVMGKSPTRGDTIYSFTDGLILTHLVNILGKHGDPMLEYEKFENQIIVFSDKLCSLFDNIIHELIKDKQELEYGEIPI